jgi:hypothetical protein
MTANALAGTSDLKILIDRGWAIFPCHSIVNGACSCNNPACDSPGKHPRTYNGVKGASKGIEVVLGWARQFPACNWGVATGEPSGIVVFDIDVRKANGFESFESLLVEAGITAVETFTVATGGGGRHLYFGWNGKPVKNRVNFRPGVDVRGDGGYVILPGSNHISGGAYVVEQSNDLAYLPDKLLSLLGSGAGVSSDSSVIAGLSLDKFLDGVEEGSRDDALFRYACKLRRQLGDERAAITLLVLTAAVNSTPPFPEKDALRKIDQAFAQDHSDLIDLDNMPFLAPQGQLPSWLEGKSGRFIREVETGIYRANVREAVDRAIRAERASKHARNRSMDGFDFIAGDEALGAAIWGEGNNLLWAEGEGLLIASDQGLGKTLTAQQLVFGRLGLGAGHLLGLPVHPLAEDKLIVYLAMDRPSQAARSLARLFTTDEEREVARKRLRVWRGPLPVDVLGSSDTLANFLEDEFGPNIGDVIGDSVKDYAPGITKDEVGAALNVSWQECLARGQNVMNLHHERKTGGDASRSNREPSLDHIYGSVWITSGQGSVLHIKGKQGENVVTYTHLKSIIDLVPPITAVHDQERGRTDVLVAERDPSKDKKAQVFLAVEALNKHGTSVTVDAVVGMTADLSKSTVSRNIKALLDEGSIEEATPFVQGKMAATYRIPERG